MSDDSSDDSSFENLDVQTKTDANTSTKGWWETLTGVSTDKSHTQEQRGEGDTQPKMSNSRSSSKTRGMANANAMNAQKKAPSGSLSSKDPDGTESLEKTKQLRSNCQGRLTTYKRKYQDMYNDPKLQEEDKLAGLLHIKTQYDMAWADYCKWQRRRLEFFPSPEDDDYIDSEKVFDEIQDEVLAVKIWMEKPFHRQQAVLDKEQQDKTVAEAARLVANVQAAVTQGTQRAAAQAPPPSPQVSTKMPKLPELQINKFHGDVTKYLPWRKAFFANIGDRKDIQDLAKWGYLCSYVDGEARECLQTLDLDEGNYKAGIERLDDRYGDEEAIIRAHVRALLNCEPIKDKPADGDLRRFHDFLEGTFMAMKKLGSDPDDAFVTPALERKLNKAILKDWDEKASELDKAGKKAGVKELIEVLKLAVKAEDRRVLRNATYLPGTSTGGAKNPATPFKMPTVVSPTQVAGAVGHQPQNRAQQHKKGKEKGKNYGNKSTNNSSNFSNQTRAPAPAQNTWQSGQYPPCTVCTKNHELSYCKDFAAMTTDKKWEAVQKARVCYSCLKKGHNTRSCPQKQKCTVDQKCLFYHHKLLHGGSREASAFKKL